MRDARAWSEVRRRNAAWLTPWEATVPPGDRSAPSTFRALVRDLHRQARQRRTLPFAVTVDDEFAGQLTVTNITGGSAQWGQLGYWVDERHAGQGVIPTAVALAVDYCLFELDLHRIEVAIRPENRASLRVVEKLAFTEIGYAPRYLHIDGAWRDHRLFAVTVEELEGGMLRRFRGSPDAPDDAAADGQSDGQSDGPQEP
jgi:ribosomal-protein-alanine N-acetyltransferase